MPRTCSVCTHEERGEIDSALLTGTPIRDIAGRFGTGKSALQRHKADHMPNSLLAAQEVEEVAHADSLLDQIRGYQSHVSRLTNKAEAAGDFRTALSGLREARGYLELLAKIVGEIDDRPQVNVLIDARVQQAIFEALEPHEEARYAVASALREIEGDA